MQRHDMPAFEVNRQIAMVDEDIKISITGLKAFAGVTVVAFVEQDNAKLISYGQFIPDSEGRVLLWKHQCIDGTYKGLDGMGLFWSMIPSSEQRKGSRLSKKDVTTPFHFHFGVVENFIAPKSWSEVKNNLLCYTVVERWYLASDIQRIPVRDGRLRGMMFSPKSGAKYPGIIDLFGTAGGLIEIRASLLASHGYTTFALAYFDYEDLPKGVEFDLDYFDEAVDFMMRHQLVDSDQGIGVVGVSKGGELVYHMASYNEDVKVCIPINATPFYSFGSHTYRGQSLNVQFHDFDKAVETKFGFIYKYCFDNREEEQNVPLEKSKSHFLIVQSMDDGAVDYNFAVEAATRVLESGNKNCVLKLYPGAGHLLEPPFTPACTFVYHKLLDGLVNYGGNVADHAQAQSRAWADILNFLAKHFKSNYKRTGRISNSHL